MSANNALQSPARRDGLVLSDGAGRGGLAQDEATLGPKISLHRRARNGANHYREKARSMRDSTKSGVRGGRRDLTQAPAA